MTLANFRRNNNNVRDIIVVALDSTMLHFAILLLAWSPLEAAQYCDWPPVECTGSTSCCCETASNSYCCSCTARIVGGVVGTLAFIAIVVALILICCCCCPGCPCHRSRNPNHPAYQQARTMMYTQPGQRYRTAMMQPGAYPSGVVYQQPRGAGYPQSRGGGYPQPEMKQARVMQQPPQVQPRTPFQQIRLNQFVQTPGGVMRAY